MTWKKQQLVCLSIKQILQIAWAGAVSFIAMILFNPFHLTNLTHTFEISVSEHAASWRQVNEWRPAFDWMDKTRTTANPVGNEEAFAVLCRSRRNHRLADCPLGRTFPVQTANQSTEAVSPAGVACRGLAPY